MKRRTNVKTWELDGEVVVYDANSGMGHVLNATALRIWSLCDGNRSSQDIEKDLAGLYPDQKDAIHRDVEDAVHQLTEIGLVEAA